MFLFLDFKNKKVIISLVSLAILGLFITSIVFFIKSLPTFTSDLIEKNLNGNIAISNISVGLKGLNAKDISIKDDTGEEILNIKEAKVSYKISDFFSKSPSYAIKKVEIDTPSFNVKRTKNGILNIASIIKKTDEEKKKHFKDSNVKLESDIIVKNGKLHYTDYGIDFKPISISLDNIKLNSHFDGKNAFDLNVQATELFPSKSIWKITGKYSIENPYVNIKGTSSDIDLNSWIAMMLPERGIKLIKGKATGNFLIRASSDELETLDDKLFFNGNCHLSDTDIRIPELGTDIQNINLSTSVTKKSFILDKCTGFIFGAPFSIKGDIADLSSQSLNFEGKVSNINHNRILKNSFVKSFGVDKFVSGGSSELKFNVGGTVEEPKLIATLNGKKINTDYGTLDSYVLEAEATKNSVYLSNVKGLFEGVDLKAHGWFFPTSKKVLLFASGNGYPYFLPSTVSISSAGFDAIVFGPIDNLTVSGDLKGYGVSAMGTGLGNIDSGFLFADNSVYLPDLYVNGNGGTVKSSAVYDLKDSKFNASVDADNFAVSSSGVSTSVSGTASVFGDPTNPVATGNLNIPNLNFNQYSISNINVPVAGNSDIVDFSATGHTMGMNFRTGGQVSPSDKQVSASFEVSNIDSSSFSKMVPKGIDVPEFKGSLSGSLAGSEDYGCFFVSNVFGNYTDQEKEMTRLIGKFGGVVKNDQNHSLIAYADVQNPTVKLPDKGVYTAFKGNVDQISAIASGSFDALSIFGSASFSNASVAKIPVSNANIEVTLENKKDVKDGFDIDIKNVAVNGDDGSLYITSTEKDLIASLSAVNVNSILNKADFSPFGVELGNYLKGSEIRNLQGLAYLRTKLEEEKNSKIQALGQFFIPDGVLGHEKFAFFSTVALNDSILDLKHFDLSIGASNFAGIGHTGLKADSPISFDIKATRGNIEKILAISSFKDIPINGRFDGDLHISGTVKNIAVNGNVVVNNAVAAGHKINKITADVNTKNGVLYVENVIFELPEGIVSGGGTIKSNGEINLSLNSDSIKYADISYLKDFVSVSEESEGNMKVALNITGTHTNPVFNASFATDPISLKGHKFESVGGNIIYDGGKVNIDNLSLKNKEESYSASGFAELRLPFRKFNPRRNIFFQFFKDMDLSLNVDKGDLAFLSSFIDPAKPLMTGEINGKLEIMKSRKARQFRINTDLKATNGKILSLPYDSLGIVIDRVNARLKNVDIDLASPKASFTMLGELDGEGDEGIYLKTSGINLAFLKEIIEIPENLAPSGECDIFAKIYGNYRNPDVYVDLKVDEATLGKTLLGDLTCEMTSERKEVDTEFIGKNEDDIGLITSKPEIYIYENEKSNVLNTNINLNGENLNASIKGDIPYYRKDFLKQSASMAMQASLKTSNLDVFNILYPLAEPSTGKINANFDITGMAPDLSIDGTATLSNGKIRPDMLKTPIESLNGDIVINGQEIALTDVKGKVGDGDFTLGGKIDLDKLKLKGMDISFKGNELQAICKMLFAGKMSCDVNFKMEGKDKKLTGNVDIKDSVLTISPEMFANQEEEIDKDDKDKILFAGDLKPKVRKAGDEDEGDEDDDVIYEEIKKRSQKKEYNLDKYIPDFFKGTALDMNLGIGDGVWATFLSSQVQAKGDLVAKGVMEKPDLEGKIRLSKGTVVIPLVSAPFKVNRGLISFKGDGFIPKVLVTGESQYSTYTSYLTVTGSMDAPNIKLEGTNTNVTSSDVLSGNVGGGRSQSNFSNMANNYMNQMAMNSMLEFSVMRPILNSLNRSLGLSDMAVEFNENGYMTVRLARALNKKETVLMTYEYSRDVKSQYHNLIGVEYRFSRGMRVRVAQDVNGGLNLWVQSYRRF